MRKTTKGIVTACAGLVIGAAFGAGPALAGPEWIPPGRLLGYYDTVGDCSSYATSLVLWDDDYDCDYYPGRFAGPYALVIERPVLIQPGFDYFQPGFENVAPPVASAPQPAPGAAPQQPGDGVSPAAAEPAAAEEPAKPAKKHPKKNKKDKVTIAAEDQVDVVEPGADIPPATATGPAAGQPVGQPLPVVRPVPIVPILPIDPCGPCWY